MEKNTDDLLKTLGEIQDPLELQNYLQKLSADHLEISQFLEDIRKQRQIKETEIIKETSLDRVYAYQILNGTRTASRDKLLCICLALHMTLKETQTALNINGNNRLSPKNKRDATVIYAIHKKNECLWDEPTSLRIRI